jgi:hypothetical protein
MINLNPVVPIDVMLSHAINPRYPTVEISADCVVMVLDADASATPRRRPIRDMTSLASIESMGSDV